VDSDTLKIVAATLSALIAVIGWSVSHFLSKRREDRTKRIELVLSRISAQIEKLYGPLLNRIEQIHTTWDVRERIFKSTEENDTEKVRAYIQSEHFFPLHQEIKEIISQNMHLLEGGVIPNSFSSFLEHSTQQVIKRQLEGEFDLELSNVEYVPWPREFPEDVASELDHLMSLYNIYLEDLDAIKKNQKKTV